MTEKLTTDIKSVALEMPVPRQITFNLRETASDPVLVLDKDGMLYRGKRIEDAGEAHRAFLEVMALMSKW